MTPEEKSLLERAVKLGEENNSILKSMRRAARISTILHVFYWLVIIALSVGSYFAIQYFVEPFIKMMPSVMNATSGDKQSIDMIIKQLQSLQSGTQ